MKVLINDLVTLEAGANPDGYIIQKMTGLGAADIRTSSFLFSGRSGGMVTDQLYGFRQITISGKVGDTDFSYADHKAARSALLNAMPIGSSFPLEITMFDGSVYVTEVSLIDMKMEYNQRGYSSDYLMQLLAADPYFYSADGGDEQSVLINRVAQGGYVTPYDLPVDWDSGSGPTIVDNNGEAIYYPRIILTDEAANPVIINQTTGERFQLDINMVAADVVVIDMLKRTVTLNGSNIIGNKTDDSNWWALQVGDNSIVLDSDSSSDDVTATVYWRNGVIGL